MCFAACGGLPPVPEDVMRPPGPVKVTLGPGDEVEVKFAYAEQFNELQKIRPDGRISLQFVGEVMAAGKTPAELRSELQTLFSSHLKHPELTVIIRSFNEQKVYVGGQVLEPGIIPLDNQLSVLEAIMSAGGFDLEKAKTKNVVVIRHQDGTRKGYAINLKNSLKGNQADTFLLQPRDIVYVPRTTITKLNQFMEQYSNKMVPDIGLTFSRTLGRTSFGYDTESD
jgi:protein involved in polysaccharide export with SLBB domain